MGGEHTEQLALGETPNIAARVQGKAEPHTVAISADTYRLVQGFFACTDLGPQKLKGLSSPLTLYEVTGEGEAQNRFDVSVQQGLTPLIGREEEVELLVRRWERAKAGQGQVVLLSGEAGIGKSRLVQVLRDHSRNEPHLSILCRCSPFYQNSALYPIIDRMQQVLEFNKDDTAETKLTKLTQSLEPVDMTDEETVALFATFLSIPLPDTHPPLQYSPQKQKEKTLQALVRWLHKTAEQQLVRLEIEDLHWADPSTLELLGLLIDQAPASRMLLLLTFRPEFAPPWPGHAHMLALQLNRLPQQEIAAMVERVAGKALPEEVVQQLLAKSDGVPLYIEEMTKNLVESGLLTETDGHYELTGPLPKMAIPSSLQDSFAARLDRLASVRELAQIGAVLGREFSHGLIHAVSRVDDPKLQNGLGQLSAADILFQRGLPPDATYTFKHALLQDAAYASLLKSQRQQFHAQTAAVLEQQFPETADIHPELVAHHYTEASLAEQAIPYWQQAGERGMRRSANQEAIGHLTQGIEVLQTLPDTPERSQHELTLQVALGVPFIATKGFAAPEARNVYLRARELCEQLGDTPETFPTLWGLYAFYFVRAEHKTAHELGEQLLRLARSQHDSGLLLEAHFALGYSLFLLAELTSARTHLEHGSALYDAQQHHSLAFTYGSFDPGVVGLCYAALTLWVLGYPDQALHRSQQAQTLAHELAYPFSLAACLAMAVILHQYRREGQAVQERGEAVVALCTEQGFPFHLAWGTIFRGWALAEQGHRAEGLGQLREGLAAWRATGAELWWSHFLALLAELQGKGGQAEEGLTSVDEALTFVERTEERHYEAACTRARLLCQQLGDTQDVSPVLYGLWQFYLARGDYTLARQLGEELLGLAAQRNEPPLSVIAHMTLGLTSYYLGELLSARRHLEEGIAVYTPAQRSSPLFRAGLDPGVGCHVTAARTLWSLGYPDQALARVHDGLALAAELAHPFSSAFALTVATWVYQFRREEQDVSEHADAAVTLSTEQGFALYLAVGTIVRGWALTTQGQDEEGLRQMRRALTDFRATGAEVDVPYYLLLLAEGYASLGQVEAGLAVLQEGWEVMERTEEHVWHAEVCRLKGALLLQQQGQVQEEAEACFQQAIAVARQQSAKSWELRAATSLARLWQGQGKRAEAQELLAPVYNWFTEGFDTADLKDAKVLLKSLS